METWEKLLEKAVHYIKATPLSNDKGKTLWSLGGGTVLMMEYRHRLSKDIDIFLPDPQWLGYFSPRFNDVIDDNIEYYDEQAEYIKLILDDGEIDFIVAKPLLHKTCKVLSMFGADIPCEHPLEIIAKKIVYRSGSFAIRDFFDLATVCFHSDGSGINEIKRMIASHAEILKHRLVNVQSFDEIRTLPEGEIIQKEGMKILSGILSLTL